MLENSIFYLFDVLYIYIYIYYYYYDYYNDNYHLYVCIYIYVIVIITHILLLLICILYIYISPLHQYVPDEFLQAEGSLCGAGGRASFHRLAACERRAGKPPRVASRFINHH